MLRKVFFLSLLVLLLSVGVGLSAQADTPLVVDAAVSLGAISPYVYGANYGGYGIVPPDHFETAKQSGVSFMRFPGGSIFDEDGRDVPNFQVDLFMTTIKLIGAEPSVQVKLFEGTPEKAAELVEYVNIKKQYNVKYWYVGNEPNLYPDYTVDDLNAQWRPIAEAMLAVDPNIVLIGPELSQYPGIAAQNPKDPNGKDWMDEFLKVNGDLVDIVSVHRYPFPQGNDQTTIDDLRNNSREWDTTIPFLHERIVTLTGGDKPVAITEINSHWNQATGGEATPDSHYNAIWFADSLGRMIRNQVEIVSFFEFYGVPSRALPLFTSAKIVPTYYVYPMYRRFGTELLTASSEDANVSIFAAKREDGALTLMVINLGDAEISKMLALTGFTAGGDAEVWRFDATHNAEMIESAAIADGATLTLPGQSLTLYIVPTGE